MEDTIPQLSGFVEPLTAFALDIGRRLIGAILLWIVGRFAIRFANRFIGSALRRQANIDETLVKYVEGASNVLLNLLLIIAVLSVFGVETTTFAGLLAAGGVAIGLAWSGLLSNFAAGAFMIILRPFQVGDMIEAGGIIGDVREIGLFVTVIDTPDNIRTYVGNNAIFSGNIRNFTANPHRRVELVAQLAHSVDHQDAMDRLRKSLAAIPNVLQEPAPDLEILEFNLAGPVLAVRPFCHNNHYWQVYFDTNRAICETFGEAKFPVPQKHLLVDRAHKA